MPDKETATELREPLWVYRLGQVEEISRANTDSITRLTREVDRLVDLEREKAKRWDQKWVVLGGVGGTILVLIQIVTLFLAISNHTALH